MKQVVFKRAENGVMKKVLQGIVVEKVKGTGKGEGKVITIKIKSDVYDKEKKANVEKIAEVPFWNSDEKKTADRADAFLEIGDFVSMMVIERDGKNTGLVFNKNNAKYKFDAYPADEVHPSGLPEYNILIGTLGSGKMSEDGTHYYTSMGIDTKDSSQADRISISFWNNKEKNPNLGNNAQKCLTPYQPADSDKKIYRKAAIVCSAMGSYFDDECVEHLSCNAYSFDKI